MMLSLMFKTKSRMDSGIYISSDYSRLRATPIQSESSSMQVPTHKMSETMTETCWGGSASICSVTNRNYYVSTGTGNIIGFRLAL